MKHNDYKEMIQFYLYEELDLEKKILFEEHIKYCDECMLTTESYKKLFAEIFNEAENYLDPKILAEARLELRGSLRYAQNKDLISTAFIGSITSFITKPLGLSVSGIAVLFVGLLIGFIVFKTPTTEDTKSASGLTDLIKINNINFIDSDPSNGQIEFTYDAIKSGHYKGNINDSELQRILTNAVLYEQNPGTRLNSINVINAAHTKILDDEIKKTLIAVSKFDDNPGVRREALKSLKEIPIDTEIKNALLYVLLNDPSSGIRIEAINTLVDAAKTGFNFSAEDISQLQNEVQVDNNNYVRYQVKNIIKEY